MNILGKRYWLFALSFLLIVPGLVILFTLGVPKAIDFTGGTLLELSFSTGVVPSTEEVTGVYSDLGITDIQVQTLGEDSLTIRSSTLNTNSSTDQISAIQEALAAISGGDVIVNRSDTVTPAISQQVTTRATQAVSVAALAVIIYITISFRKVPNSFRYGICAIIAMAHDVLIVFSLVAIGGQLFGFQVDSLFLTALLTVIGFSVQDKIVVFDRIRENTPILRKISYEKLVNHSIVQTLQRSINTQLMTVEFLLLALALFGGITLREFSIILLVGLLSGTYSSIFIAAPLLVVWETKEWKNWFRKPKTNQAA
ncbi:MAG TPA: protein translocase subunit SecF [Longilinea sp.]|nr:protein translocase subunit SecF [Longilinea sp.]